MPRAIPADFAPAAVVFAVKPQNAAETLPLYRALRRAGGVPVDHGRPHDRRHARAARRRRGDRAGDAEHAGRGAPGRHRRLPRRRRRRAAQRALCERLLQAIGVVAWVEDEALLDPVTAVSGSGPAYVFLLAELMEQAALEQGIPRRSGAPAGAADGVRLRRAAGGQRRGRGGAAHGGHQSRRHHRARAGRADGRGSLAREHCSQAIAAATRRSRELAG